MAAGHGAPRFENVVDQQHVAAHHVVAEVAGDRHRALAHGPGAVARQGHEIDPGAHAGAVQRADEVGGEDKAALENGDNQNIVGHGGGDLAGQRLDARGDILGAVQRGGRGAR